MQSQQALSSRGVSVVGGRSGATRRRAWSAGPSRAWALAAVAGLLTACPAFASEAAAWREAPAAAAAPAPAIDAAAALPVDPSLTVGRLENGLKYVLKRHANPEGRASVWLHISTGSLNEQDETRGLAHYLEHMAFNGSENFPPGSVVDFFQSLGLSFGRDQNAFTSFDQTTYQLALPDTRPETLDKALTFLSDVGLRLLLLPEEIEKEREIIVEEKRTRASAQQRVQEYVLERLAPGSTLGQRLPIGTEQTIRSVQRPQFVDYYERYYVPSNMTLMIVGDFDVAGAVPQIEKFFAQGRKADRPTDRDAGVRAQTQSRAIVATDAELKSASVSITRVLPAAGPTDTVGELRRELVELVGTWAFNRRIEAELARGGPSFLGAASSVQDLFNAVRLTSVEAEGQSDKWRAMLAESGEHLQRARLHGFTEREVGDARSAILSQAEDAVQREATLPARVLLARINAAEAAGEPAMSAQQRLDLLRQLLPGVTAQEVSETFTSLFDPEHVTFVLEVPAGGDVPSEAELLSAGREAVSVTPAPRAEEARAQSLLEQPPTPGSTAEKATHEASGVASAWLSNGVRVHHRFMDVRKNEATIIISLAGGVIEETAANRGVTAAAMTAWDRPATSRLTSTQIRDLMTGKKVRVSGGAGSDTLSLTISGNPADLEAGLQLAYLMLTDPVVEPAGFTQWQDGQVQAIQQRKVQPQGVAAEALSSALYPPNELRQRPLEIEQVRALTREAAQAWLTRIVTTAPIEVAVVGDVDAAAASALVERYLGSLPARARVSAQTLADRRKVERPRGPITTRTAVPTQTPAGVVFDGFFGTDQQNVRDVRLLTLASRIVSTRMNKIVREEKQLVYSIGAISRPAGDYPGYGLFLAQAPTDPAKVDALAAAIDEIYAAFAKGGPTAEELETARKQIDNTLAETMKDPEFWLSRLSTIELRGLKLDDTMEARAAYPTYTAEQITEAFSRYYKPEARFTVIVAPAAKGG